MRSAADAAAGRRAARDGQPHAAATATTATAAAASDTRRVSSLALGLNRIRAPFRSFGATCPAALH